MSISTIKDAKEVEELEYCEMDDCLGVSKGEDHGLHECHPEPCVSIYSDIISTAGSLTDIMWTN